MSSEFGDPVIVPSLGSFYRCPLRSIGSLGTVPRLLGYYETLRLPDAHPETLRLPSRSSTAIAETPGPPRFLESPPCVSALLSDPDPAVEPDRYGIHDAAADVPTSTARGD
jgi:hypothetical protein